MFLQWIPHDSFNLIRSFEDGFWVQFLRILNRGLLMTDDYCFESVRFYHLLLLLLLLLIIIIAMFLYVKKSEKVEGFMAQGLGFCNMKWKIFCKRIRRRRVKDLRSCCRSCCSKVSKRGRGLGRRRRRRRRRSQPNTDRCHTSFTNLDQNSQMLICRRNLCFFSFGSVWRSADLQLAAKNPQRSLFAEADSLGSNFKVISVFAC